jgi:hypothetical protein
VNAARRYDILVRRGRDRVDAVEVVDRDDGEVVLFWDCTPRQASRMNEALRADLRQLAEEEFLARWSAAEAADFG